MENRRLGLSSVLGNKLSKSHSCRTGLGIPVELIIFLNFLNLVCTFIYNSIHRTLTTPVELIKCLRSIKQYAFEASEYPVVITLEDHLTPDLQAKVAEVGFFEFIGIQNDYILIVDSPLPIFTLMVTQTFGDILFCPGSEVLKEFPSPESLKKRIIISTKPPKDFLQAKEAKEKEDDSQKGKALGDEEAWGKEVPSLKGGASADDYQV